MQPSVNERLVGHPHPDHAHQPKDQAERPEDRGRADDGEDPAHHGDRDVEDHPPVHVLILTAKPARSHDSGGLLAWS
ncbi:hypothetical protein ABE10_25405 [Bacillus toyonensis]|nr:hypothetical protein [Bacillus toyonensis]